MLEISEWQITAMLSVLLMLILITATFSYIEWKRNNKYNEYNKYNKYTDDLISKAKKEFDAIKKRNEKDLKRLSDILHRHTKGD